MPREWRIDTVDSSSVWKDDAKDNTIEYIKRLEDSRFVVVTVCRSAYAGSFDVTSYRDEEKPRG